MKEAINEAIKEVQMKHNLKTNKMMKLIRLVVCGLKVSIYRTLVIQSIQERKILDSLIFFINLFLTVLMTVKTFLNFHYILMQIYFFYIALIFESKHEIP